PARARSPGMRKIITCGLLAAVTVLAATPAFATDGSAPGPYAPAPPPRETGARPIPWSRAAPARPGHGGR
ncbi:hypothetical protein ACWEPZ_33720, partial [Streptomyces sp. NPDC004288]